MKAPANLREFELTRKSIGLVVAIVLACVTLALLYAQIDVPALHQRAQGVNGGLIFALIVVLPMLGFPVSVAHAVAGVRFGWGLGLLLVTVSIILQMLASYALVKALPRLFAKRMQPFRKRLPEGAHTPITQFTMLLPGAPFFAQNYVLPLIGVPLRTYFAWGLPIHIAKSAVGIIFGDMSDHLTPGRLTGFAIYAVAMTVASAWAFRRLQLKMKDRRSKADDLKRPG
jgi:uncharacterized membrane protein YdjX (TVP38/TMEM64 family)